MLYWTNTNDDDVMLHTAMLEHNNDDVMLHTVTLEHNDDVMLHTGIYKCTIKMMQYPCWVTATMDPTQILTM